MAKKSNTWRLLLSYFAICVRAAIIGTIWYFAGFEWMVFVGLVLIAGDHQLIETYIWDAHKR